MGKSIIGIGDRSFSGDTKNIYYVGDLNISSSKFNSAKLVGDIDFNDCIANKISAVGDLNFINCKIKYLNSIGEVKFNSICEIDLIKFYGDMHIDILECKTFIVKNKPNKARMSKNNDCNINIISKINGDTFINNGETKIIGEMNFNTIINNGTLQSDDDIECEEFYSVGSLESKFINSEISYIYPTNKSKLNLLVGCEINVTRKLPKEAKLTIPQYIKENEIIVIDEIEGDIINVECVMSKSISGIDVNIGELSIVDTVYYKEKINISPKAIVTNIVKV